MRRLVALLAGLLLLLPGCSGEEEGTEVYSGMSLTEVIHTLESGGSTERQRAAATLGWMGTAPGAREALYRGEDAGGAPGPTASTPHAVRALVAALEDPVPLVRLQVARSLRLLWPHAAEAAPALAGRLEDEDPEVRFEAAFALAEMTEELDAAWPVLLEALVDESKPVLASRVLEDLHTGKERRADAAVRILGLNDELGARLAGVIADDARIPELRRRAIEAAVVSRPGRADERLAEALVTALADMDESVAAAAAAALASRPETLRIALPRLLALSRQGEPAARARGLDAVRIAAPGPEDALEPALAALDHEDRRVRLAGLRLLAALGPAAVEAAERARTFLAPEVAGVDAELRVAAADAVWRLTGDVGAVLPVCLATLPDPVAIRIAGEIGPKAGKAVPVLVIAVGRGSAAAARSLGWILEGRKNVPEELLDAVESEDPALRAAAAGAAARIEPDLRERLLAVLADGAVSAEPRAFLVELRTFGEAADSVAPVLRRHLDSRAAREPPSRWADLAVTVALIDPEAPIDDLVRALGHERADERRAAVRALGTLGPRAASAKVALESLAMDDPSEAVRREVGEALSRIGE